MMPLKWHSMNFWHKEETLILKSLLDCPQIEVITMRLQLILISFKLYLWLFEIQKVYGRKGINAYSYEVIKI